MRNFFNLFLLNLKDMWKNHRFVFIVINLFMFFSFSFLLLSYDICSYETANNYMDTYIDNTFIYEINSLDNIESKIDDFVKNTKNIRCIFFSFRNNADDTISKNFIERQDKNFNDEIYVLYYGDLVTSTPYTKGRWFYDSEMKDGSKVVLTPNASLLNKMYTPKVKAVDYKVGSEYSINGEIYKVIGQVNSIEHSFVIPYNSLTDKGVITNIHISIMEKYSEIGNKKFNNKVKKYFDVELNEEAIPRSLKIESYIIIAYLLMFNISIMSLVYIYSYLLSQRKTIIGLFNVYGMNKKTRIRYLLIEYLIWFLVDFILAIIFSNIFIWIEKCIYNKHFRFLSFYEYLIFLGAYLLIYFVCVSPIVNRNVDIYGKFQEFTMEDDK